MRRKIALAFVLVIFGCAAIPGTAACLHNRIMLPGHVPGKFTKAFTPIENSQAGAVARDGPSIASTAGAAA